MIFGNAIIRPAQFRDWDFAALPEPLGGSEFIPLAIIGLANVLEYGVARSDAAWGDEPREIIRRKANFHKQ